MNTELREFVSNLAKTYDKQKAEETFNLIKEKAESVEEYNYPLYAIPFDYEPSISYLLFKESYRLVALDSIKDIEEQEDEETKNVLYRMLSSLFGTLTFDSETDYLSKAAADVYIELLGDKFDSFLELALENKKKLIFRMLDNTKNQEDREQIYKFYEDSVKHSVYKEQIIKVLDEAFKEHN
jgi:hypothetical protein